MKRKKKAVAVPIVNIHNPAPDTWRMTLHDPDIAQSALAGHFINISVPQPNNLLWRRPLGIHQTDPEQGTFDILFKAIGRGTQALTRLKVNDKLDILGPLGNTFKHSADMQEAIMVAGGLGIALFPLLLQNLQNKNITKNMFFGVKTAKEFCCLESLLKHNVDLHLTTEDGSRGEQGFITVSLERYLATHKNPEHIQMYVCGPTPMMQAVQKIAEKYNISTQVSLENMMACGFGACMGCPVPLVKPLANGATYLLACKDGPVFNMKDIIIND